MLFALATWLYPIKVASAHAQRSPQTVSEVHDQAGAGPAQANTSEHQEESKTKEQVTSQSNDPVQVSKEEPKSDNRILAKPTTPTPYSGRHYSKEEVQDLIRHYSSVYGISSDTPFCIAKYESGYNQYSKNRNSTASGVFQYLSSTWSSTDEGKLGLSVFDADANVKAAVKYMAIHRNTRPWVVAPKCPSLTFIK